VNDTALAQPWVNDPPASLRGSLSRFLSSQGHAVRALGAFVVILALQPTRLLRSRSTPSTRERPASVGHVGIQIHLGDRSQAAQLERRLRDTLGRLARTWAPHPLPIDQVCVHAAAPPEGRAATYSRWATASDSTDGYSSLAVVSLGLYQGDRPLEIHEIVGALVVQVGALVDDRYERQHGLAPSYRTAVSPRVTAEPVMSTTAPEQQSQLHEFADDPALVDPAVLVEDAETKLTALMKLARGADPLDAGQTPSGAAPSPDETP
jgi:hypothetical protein